MSNTWKIWFRRYRHDGKPVGAGVLINEYKNKEAAFKKASQLYDITKPDIGADIDGDYTFQWTVAQENPWE